MEQNGKFLIIYSIVSITLRRKISPSTSESFMLPRAPSALKSTFNCSIALILATPSFLTCLPLWLVYCFYPSSRGGSAYFRMIRQL